MSRAQFVVVIVVVLFSSSSSIANFLPPSVYPNPYPSSTGPTTRGQTEQSDPGHRRPFPVQQSRRDNSTETRRHKHSATTRIVDTQYGRLKGMVLSVDLPGPQRTERVEAFLGIQYASLLGGELRFMPPTGPMEKWDGIKVVNKFRPVCPQHVPDLEDMKEIVSPLELERLKLLHPFVTEQQEDCLNMNIYVPRREETEAGLKLPVLLFVHGDSFHFGTGNAYEGGVMAASGSLVLVTFNYRLGIFGFLSTGDSHAPGNYAILDLVAALHFIRKNIASFGGDPSQVTLMGHDRAAALINFLLISPVTKGKNLFKRAIISGGSSLSSWAVDKSPTAKTIPLAYQLNCTQSPTVRLLDPLETKDLVACLKRASVESLLRIKIHSAWFAPSFGPVIDQSTLNAKNLEVLDSSTSPASLAGDQTDFQPENKHIRTSPNSSSFFLEDANRPWKNLQSGSEFGRASSRNPAERVDKGPTEATGRKRLQSTAQIFDDVPLIVGFPSADPCSFNFPRSIYDLFHVYSNRSSSSSSSSSPVGSSSLLDDRRHSIHQMSRSRTSRDNSSAANETSRVFLSPTSKEVRFLRTFTQSLFAYHRQKIYDVLLYHYRDWEARPKLQTDLQGTAVEGGGGGGIETFNVEQLLVDGLYLSPLLRMLRARVSSSSPQQHPVWLYSLEETISDQAGNWFSGSDYYEEQRDGAAHSSSRSCFDYETLISSDSKTDGRNSAGEAETEDSGETRDRGPRTGIEGDNARLLRAVIDLRLSYSFGLETNYETRRKTSPLRNAMRLWTEKLMNFIHAGNPNVDTSRPTNHDFIGRDEEKIHWPEYDLGKQSYLSIGDKLETGNHYRNSKMSLWLDLIPRIHRSDNLTEQHHLLDNFDDPRTFACEGLDSAEYNRLVRSYSQRFQARETTSQSSSRRPSASSSSYEVDRGLPSYTLDSHMSDDSSFAKRDNQLMLLESTNAKRSTPFRQADATASTPELLRIANPVQSSPIPSIGTIDQDEPSNKRRNSGQSPSGESDAGAADSDGHDAKDEEDSSFALSGFRGIAQVPLGITVGVGCVLLVLNVIVFAAVFYQKSKARRCLEKRQREAAVCCRHAETSGVGNCDSSPTTTEETGEKDTRGLHRDRHHHHDGRQGGRRFHCELQPGGARLSARAGDQPSAGSFSEFEKASYTSSADYVGCPGGQRFNDNYGDDDDDQQPLTAAAASATTREQAGFLRSSAVHFACKDNRSTSSVSSASGSLGSMKHYPLPPPPPPSNAQRAACQLHPNQLLQQAHQNQAAGNGAFERPPQQQLLTKDVAKLSFKRQQQQQQQQPQQQSLKCLHDPSRHSGGSLSTCSTSTTVTTTTTTVAAVSVSSNPPSSSSSSSSSAAVVVGSVARVERHEIPSTSVKGPSWKSTDVDDSCYEEALLNELSKLELESYENDTSTLV